MTVCVCVCVHIWIWILGCVYRKVLSNRQAVTNGMGKTRQVDLVTT